jgi:hypothetical protein
LARVDCSRGGRCFASLIRVARCSRTCGGEELPHFGVSESTEAAPRLWSAAMVGAWWSAALVDAWSGMVVVWSTEASFKGKPKRRQAERKARRALRSGRDAGIGRWHKVLEGRGSAESTVGGDGWSRDGQRVGGQRRAGSLWRCSVVCSRVARCAELVGALAGGEGVRSV